MLGEIAVKEIQSKKDKLINLSKSIWEAAEVGYKEEKSCKYTADFLKEEGFNVEVGYTGIPTAIRATWGEGKPCIGFLGEYDALPGLSQNITTSKEQLEQDAPGHGCGHNLLGVSCVTAVVGIKKEMQEKGLKGTIIYYGCPAEELLTGKTLMAREGAFRELDIAFAWHPGSTYLYSRGKFTAMNSAKFHFKGKTAHAGADPHNGRSALDAAELMSIGSNYLREHVTDDVRIHYAYTEVNGAPNVVPDRTTVWYYVRALSRDVAVDAYERLIDVAKGAAMMTGTEVDIEFLGGCYDIMQNEILLNLIRDTSIELGPIDWTEEELKFAEEIDKAGTQPESADSKTIHLYNNPDAPIVNINQFGSSDVGDVQHIVPGVFFMTPSASATAGNHTWKVTACSGHSIGMKGMIKAGEIMAVSAIKAMEDPSIIKMAKDEFDKQMDGKPYICPIDDTVPATQITGL